MVMTDPNRPARLPDQFVQAGDAWPGFRFRVRNAELSPVDLTAGWSDWTAMFRPGRGSARSVTLDLDLADADTGWIGVSCDEVATRAMGGSGGFDVQATGVGGVRTWVEGNLIWQEDYTR